MPLFDRKSPIRFEAFCRNLHCCCEFRRGASITHQPKVPVKNRPNATKNRPDATENRPDATFLCHFATLLRHFVQRGNSDLRRIVFDFLTNTVRVGESERSTLNRYRSTARHRCLRPQRQAQLGVLVSGRHRRPSRNGSLLERDRRQRRPRERVRLVPRQMGNILADHADRPVSSDHRPRSRRRQARVRRDDDDA